jgi:hypothetical protein
MTSVDIDLGETPKSGGRFRHIADRDDVAKISYITREPHQFFRKGAGWGLNCEECSYCHNNGYRLHITAKMLDGSVIAGFVDLDKVWNEAESLDYGDAGYEPQLLIKPAYIKEVK